MASATTARPELSDEDFVRLAALVKDADTVELKLTVPDHDHRATNAALGIDPLDSQIRQVFFFDTPDLTLDKHGVVVRARRVQKMAGEQQTKTRTALEYFSKHIEAESGKKTSRKRTD